MALFDFLKSKKNNISQQPLLCDVHSHLLPGIDDGVDTVEESLEILREFAALGYKKVITTPHIMSDTFRNTPEIIHEKLKLIRQAIETNNIPIKIEAAAEYYLDEYFIELIESDNKLLTFGDNYLLFETSFTVKPLFLLETIFKLQSLGYKPVLAHPERYYYMIEDWEFLEDIYNRGVVLQLNLNSLSGYYSKPIKKMAEKLVKHEYITLVGSDCHSKGHLIALKHSLDQSITKKLLLQNNLINNTL